MPHDSPLNKNIVPKTINPDPGLFLGKDYGIQPRYAWVRY